MSKCKFPKHWPRLQNCADSPTLVWAVKARQKGANKVASVTLGRIEWVSTATARVKAKVALVHVSASRQASYRALDLSMAKAQECALRFSVDGEAQFFNIGRRFFSEVVWGPIIRQRLGD